MSKKSNVHPDHYKTAGRDRPDDAARARLNRAIAAKATSQQHPDRMGKLYFERPEPERQPGSETPPAQAKTAPARSGTAGKGASRKAANLKKARAAKKSPARKGAAKKTVGRKAAAARRVPRPRKIASSPRKKSVAAGRQAKKR